MVFLSAPALPADLHALPALAPTATVAASAATPATGWSEYTVRGGDTLIGLAAIHRTTVGELATKNSITNPRALRAGATILVPTSSATAATATPATPATPSAATSAPAPAAPARSTSGETSFAGIDGIPAVSRSVAANRALLATATVPTRTATHDLIVEIANQHGVDPRLVLAVAMQESGWNQRNVSPANAIGVMQVIPDAGDWAEHLIGRKLNLLDTRDNITAGVVILRALGRLAGSEEQAVAAYYQGLSSVKAKGWYTDTRSYVRSVLALKSRV